MPTIDRPPFRLMPALAAALLVAALGCREDTESPAGPEPVPALATTTTAALAFYQVSAGEDYTCGVTTDNRAYCWGHNTQGELGDGTTTGRLAPVAVAGGLRFRQVSAGFFTTCGVTTDYRAYCWGANDLGELGDGTTTPRLTPIPVAGGRQFRQVETNFEHSCGVSYPDNRAYCWGDNRDGALGNGTNTGPESGYYGPYSSRPVAVVGTLAFRQVSAGYYHTCGVTTDSRAFCWGLNKYGQIGDSSTAYRRLKPSRVAGTRQYRQVDAGADYTCAVSTGDRAFCWGDGRQGQVGNGKAYLSFWPKAVAGGLSIARVTAAWEHTCGETTLNRAYCWGANFNGQLGDGTTNNSLTPVAVAGGLYFSQVSTGLAHTCGRTPDAVAYCWGRNFEGQLGNGTQSTSQLTPVAVTTVLSLAAAAADGSVRDGNTVMDGATVHDWEGKPAHHLRVRG
jgi:alpha-tubulin suppressor-like RCC1 family protein